MKNWQSSVTKIQSPTSPLSCVRKRFQAARFSARRGRTAQAWRGAQNEVRSTDGTFPIHSGTLVLVVVLC